MRDCLFPTWPVPLAQLTLFALYALVLGVFWFVVGESLPRRWFRFDKFPYKIGKWERNGAVYDKIRIRKWKDRVPDNSKLFPWLFPKKVKRFHDIEFTRRLLQETCEAEFVHWALIALSPLLFFVLRPAWGVGCLLFYDLVNLPFIAIQRYNRARLIPLYERQRALAMREAKK